MISGLIETWDVLKCVKPEEYEMLENGLIETWDVLKSQHPCNEFRGNDSLIETWDVLKYPYSRCVCIIYSV